MHASSSGQLQANPPVANRRLSPGKPNQLAVATGLLSWSMETNACLERDASDISRNLAGEPRLPMADELGEGNLI